MKNLFIAAGLSFFFAFSANAGLGINGIPVQDGGRVKPLDTFARESLKLTWGRETWSVDGKAKRAAVPIILSWMLAPTEWDDTKFIQVRHNGLREALGLDSIRTHYSPNELLNNQKISVLIQDLRSIQEKKEKLNPFYQAVQTLEAQINTYHGIRSGLGIRLLPNSNGDAWIPLAQMPEKYRAHIQKISSAFIQLAQTDNITELDLAADAMVEDIQKDFGSDYADFPRIKAEMTLYNLHPFMYAWICYLIATILFAVGFSRDNKKINLAAWAVLAIGFAFHTYGFGLRVYIMGRPPVSNMYETVIWVAWGSLLIASLLYKFFNQKILVPAAALGAMFCLILSDLAPQVLDKSLSPLEAVLRDNFWLLTHVLTITLSYAGFFVAFIISDVVLFWYLRGEKKNAAKIASGATAIYRCIQVGVVLIATGVILGGIWADYSWGRFWGWDPKETWALIALLGYLAVLHGRLVGWVKNFALAALGVLGFSLVIMAWYGVNFVLGAGLHTYGFGAGGVEYVAGFVAIHILYVIFVATVRQSRLKTKS